VTPEDDAAAAAAAGAGAGEGAIADGIADLTAAFLTTALDREVAAVVAEPLGAGQMGATHRLALRYGPGTSGPATLVAKLAAEDPARRTQVADGYRKEVGFYRHVAPTVDIATPVSGTRPSATTAPPSRCCSTTCPRRRPSPR